MCQVGPNKGNKSGGVFSSVKNSLAVCPGDPPASGENGDFYYVASDEHDEQPAAE